jgi:anti-anti-sigma regulatory factor
MSVVIEQAQGEAPVTILVLRGDLDASNYRQVIAKAEEAYAAGARSLLVDMSDVPFMASSGMVALHSIVLLFGGEERPDLEHGWEAFHAIGRDQDKGVQKLVKLLNPQPRVMRTLEVTGLKAFFEIYSERDAAIASFG